MTSFLGELSESDLAELLQTPPDTLRAQAERELETRRRLSWKKFARSSLEVNIRYEGDQSNGQRGRIMLEGRGRDPLLVSYPGEDDPLRRLKSGLALPAGFPGRGEGVRINFSLQPTSNDYNPINWVRFNNALKLSKTFYGPEMTPEEFAELPGTPLRASDRKSVLLRYLGAE